MTVVDLRFQAGDVFVAGVSNQEFSSTLRRIPYPFTGAASAGRDDQLHSARVNVAVASKRSIRRSCPIRTLSAKVFTGDRVYSAWTFRLTLLPSRREKE